MLAVIGTVPDDKFLLKAGIVSRQEEYFFIEGEKIQINRGTPLIG